MLGLRKPQSQRDKNWEYLGLGQVSPGGPSRRLCLQTDPSAPKKRHWEGEQPCCIPVGPGVTSQMTPEVMVGPGCNSKAESASLPAVLHVEKPL